MNTTFVSLKFISHFRRIDSSQSQWNLFASPFHISLWLIIAANSVVFAFAYMAWRRVKMDVIEDHDSSDFLVSFESLSK